MATKRVLIIDDEADVRAVLQGCLEDIAGWEVMTAASAKEGLVQVLTDLPDAILLDVMMPGMDGVAFLKALRKYAQESTLAVVFLTAKSNLTELMEDSSGLDVRGVIAKPFDPFLLVEQLADLLGWEAGLPPESHESY